MVFSSATFLLFFLPISVALYYLMPGRAAKNGWLFAASLVFYAWGEPVYIWLMLVSVLGNWLFGIAIGSGPKARRRALLVADLALNLALLGFFKYEGFLAGNVNSLLGAQVVPDLELSLPIGISFYTLQAVSYIVDVYRGEVAPQRNVVYLGMYIACFPQLVAGPIVRYSTIQDQVENRRENLADFCAGLRLFSVGLAKKVLLANVVAVLADKMLAMGGPAVGAVGAWAGLLAYTFQIYFDFSGYSDMAIGLGKMFGFKYLRNFNYPYLSKSAAEFWRRWHISLSSFFRDYVYIPLGGSRVRTPRWVFNIAVVWAITGLWHGAAWNFVLWGVYYGVLLVCEKLVWGRALAKLPGLVQHAYGILVFMLGWLVFWIGDMGAMRLYAVGAHLLGVRAGLRGVRPGLHARRPLGALHAHALGGRQARARGALPRGRPARAQEPLDRRPVRLRARRDGLLAARPPVRAVGGRRAVRRRPARPARGERRGGVLRLVQPVHLLQVLREAVPWQR